MRSKNLRAIFLAGIFTMLLAGVPAVAQSVEDLFWNEVKNSTNAEDFQLYLKNYPTGKYAEEARARINPKPSRTPNPQPTPAAIPPSNSGLGLGSDASSSNADFLRSWTASVNKKLPLPIGGVIVTKATSWCPSGCDSISPDYFIKISGSTPKISGDSKEKEIEANAMRPFMLIEYCSSGANLRNIESLISTEDSTRSYVYNYRIKPGDCPNAKKPPGTQGADSLEDQVWDEIKDSSRAEDFDIYLNDFPDGKYSTLAKLKRSRLAVSSGDQPEDSTDLNALIQCMVETSGGNLNVRSESGRVIGSLKNKEIVFTRYSEKKNYRLKVGQYRQGKLVFFGWASEDYLKCSFR